MNIWGMDLSLTATGLAHFDRVEVLRPKTKGIERLSAMYGYMLDATRNADVALIEGYSFGSAFGREALGELGGVVRLALFENRVPFTTVAPSALKKYATGKGNCKKDAVISEATKRSNTIYEDNNAADAWWLYQIGLAHYEPHNAIQMPELNRTALEKIEWPELAS